MPTFFFPFGFYYTKDMNAFCESEGMSMESPVRDFRCIQFMTILIFFFLRRCSRYFARWSDALLIWNSIFISLRCEAETRLFQAMTLPQFVSLMKRL